MAVAAHDSEIQLLSNEARPSLSSPSELETGNKVIFDRNGGGNDKKSSENADRKKKEQLESVDLTLSVDVDSSSLLKATIEEINGMMGQ